MESMRGAAPQKLEGAREGRERAAVAHQEAARGQGVGAETQGRKTAGVTLVAWGTRGRMGLMRMRAGLGIEVAAAVGVAAKGPPALMVVVVVVVAVARVLTAVVGLQVAV